MYGYGTGQHDLAGCISKENRMEENEIVHKSRASLMQNENALFDGVVGTCIGDTAMPEGDTSHVVPWRRAM
jgi:hypothetical protein